MNWTPTIKKVLSIGDEDIEILEAISTAKSLQDIAEETKIPRTSVAYSLKTLVKRGLVEQSKYGKRFRYIALSPSRLTEYMQKALDEVHIANTEKKGVRVKTSIKDEFIIHVGAKEIVPAYKRIAFENKNERIKAIQHNSSYKTIFEKLGLKELAEFNEAIKKNKLIIDGMLNVSAYKRYQEEIAKEPEKYKEAVKSLEGRMADYTVFPDNVFDHHAEIWLFKTTTLIINWFDEVAIEIINHDMTAMLQDMFEYVKAGGQKIDHNEAMRKIIADLDIDDEQQKTAY